MLTTRTGWDAWVGGRANRPYKLLVGNVVVALGESPHWTAAKATAEKLGRVITRPLSATGVVRSNLQSVTGVPKYWKTRRGLKCSTISTILPSFTLYCIR
jgi:hypothetical protein